MPNNSYIEKRQNYRIPFDSKVIYTDGNTTGTAYAANISHGGLFLLSMNSFPKETELHLSFLLPTMDGSVCIKGRVMHVVFNQQRADIECGMGFEFLDLSKSQTSCLNLHLMNSKMNYKELQKVLAPKKPNMVEVRRLLKNLPPIHDDLLYLRYRVNRICALFDAPATKQKTA